MEIGWTCMRNNSCNFDYLILNIYRSKNTDEISSVFFEYAFLRHQPVASPGDDFIERRKIVFAQIAEIEDRQIQKLDH